MNSFFLYFFSKIALEMLLYPVYPMSEHSLSAAPATLGPAAAPAQSNSALLSRARADRWLSNESTCTGPGKISSISIANNTNKKLKIYENQNKIRNTLRMNEFCWIGINSFFFFFFSKKTALHWDVHSTHGVVLTLCRRGDLQKPGWLPRITRQVLSFGIKF